MAQKIEFGVCKWRLFLIEQEEKLHLRKVYLEMYCNWIPKTHIKYNTINTSSVWKNTSYVSKIAQISKLKNYGFAYSVMS